MKILGPISVAVALMAWSSAQASDANWGYVSYITPAANGYVYFIQSGTRTSLPGCASSSQPQRWVFDATTPAGQARLAVLLSAFGMHKQIYVYGLGSCIAGDTTENVNFFHTGD